MSLLNHLTDSYEIFAALAHVASTCTRSILRVVLPLATSHMFSELGIAGACSLIGGLSAIMCVSPPVFICKGPAIQAKSKFCIALREQKEAMQRQMDAQRAKREIWRARKLSKYKGREATKSRDHNFHRSCKTKGRELSKRQILRVVKQIRSFGVEAELQENDEGCTWGQNVVRHTQQSS
ncbi:hypothetical protein E4U54_000465 [Claviceps lovelessii]|nr:hypothetical protein E4U54_000465 [Claviceps lovelessii]